MASMFEGIKELTDYFLKQKSSSTPAELVDSVLTVMRIIEK